jgi:enediyne biosynthesis protein E4
MSRSWLELKSWSWLGIGLLILALVAGWIRARAGSWRAELSLAREAMNARRYGSARERLSRLAEHWTNDGEVFLLLGECELQRGRRDEAIAALGKVLPSTPSFARAARLRASTFIQMGRYSPAEALLLQALAEPKAGRDYELDRDLNQLYRRQGRIDDRRRVLRTSWCRSDDAVGVLRELWMLDRAAIPIEVWSFELDHADNGDDRVWLGRAHHAIKTGNFRAAGRWIESCLKRRPDDPAVWGARLELALATEDVAGFWAAVAHVPVDRFDATAVKELRVWLAARQGRTALERLELTALVRDAPGNTEALERLAVLATEAGQIGEAEQLRRRKGDIDRIQHKFNQILLDGSIDARQTEVLAGLALELGRTFDARGWAILAEVMRPLSDPAGETLSRPTSPATFPRDLVAQAVALSQSSLLPIVPEFGSREDTMLSARLADLRAASAPPRDNLAASQTAANIGDPIGAIPAFIDDATAVGLSFSFDNGQTPQRLLAETLSGGVGLLDYDGDGWFDVYCVQGGDVHLGGGGGDPGEAVRTPGDRIFRNRGDGTFTDVTEASGIAAIAWGRGYGQGVTVGDYDNDGHPDLFVTRLQAYTLYHNRGNGTFEDVTSSAGLSGTRDTPTSATFADLDNDGDLDLYVCHYMLWDPNNPKLCRNRNGDPIYCAPFKVEPAPDHVFRNDAGRFVDVTTTAGFAESSGRGLGVVAADFDDDHRVDLFVTNDGTANYLYRNQGSFRFEEVGHLAGVAGNAAGGYQAGMGVACGDLDGDGRPDLMVTNFYGESTTLYKNLGQGLFADRSAASGIGLFTRYLLGFGIAFADVNNDGWLDVITANGHVNGPAPTFRYPMPSKLYQGRSDGRFVEISHQAGPPWDVPRVGRGLAAGDLDNDGRCDALVVAQDGPLVYFHNRTRETGHFITLQLEGTASNRDGVGALVTLTAGARRQVAQRVGGGSYMSAVDPRLHFGLGSDDHVEKVEVRWPSGKTDRWSSLPAGTGYCLREGDRAPRPLAGFPRRHGS